MDAARLDSDKRVRVYRLYDSLQFRIRRVLRYAGSREREQQDSNDQLKLADERKRAHCLGRSWMTVHDTPNLSRSMLKRLA